MAEMLHFGRRTPGLLGRLAALVGLRTYEYCPRRREHQLRAAGWELTLRARRLSDFQCGLSLIDWGTDRDRDDHRWSLNLRVPGANLFVGLPAWLEPRRASPSSDRMHDTFGASLQSVDVEFPSELVVEWGRGESVLRLEMPWALRFHRASRLLQSGAWYHRRERDALGVHRARLARRNRWRARLGLPARPDSRADETWRTVWEHERALVDYAEVHDYTYVLRSGEAQDRRATVTVREVEHRRSWLRWLPALARVRRSIDVQFSGEVGERTGSWKGGCVGCGYELRPGELPVHALRRMESERRFS